MSKVFLGLFSFTILWWAGSSFIEAGRYLPGFMGGGIVGFKGEVIFFYKESDKIVVKQCSERLSSDCQLNKGVVIRKVSAHDFKNSLKMALKIPVEDYRCGIERKTELCSIDQGSSTGELNRGRNDLKLKVFQIRALIEDFGGRKMDSDFFSELQGTLSLVEEQLGDGTGFDEAVKEINGRVDDLVDFMISEGESYKYVFSKQKTGFVFNILKASLRTPRLSASWKWIPKGRFIMGSPPSEIGRDSDEGQEEVKISRSFDIMATEVTQMQWFLVMGHNPSRFKKPEHCHNYMSINGEGLCPHSPVERVSWSEVQQFITKLNKAQGLNNCDGKSSDPKGCYRLPSETEWEYAARGKAIGAYFFGNGAKDLGRYAWFQGNSVKRTHTVGLKRSNFYGLYDVYGNVWEWVQDEYTSFGLSRVVRGGSWDDEARFLRSACRASGLPSDRLSNLGFRLVRQID